MDREVLKRAVKIEKKIVLLKEAITSLYEYDIHNGTVSLPKEALSDGYIRQAIDNIFQEEINKLEEELFDL